MTLKELTAVRGRSKYPTVIMTLKLLMKALSSMRKISSTADPGTQEPHNVSLRVGSTPEISFPCWTESTLDIGNFCVMRKKITVTDIHRLE